MKIVRRYFLFMLIFSQILAQSAYCMDAGPQDLVRHFYAWYIQKAWLDPTPKGGKKPEVFNDEIYKYVSVYAVDRLRVEYERMNMDCDYFTQSQDFEEKWANTLTVSDPIRIDDHTSVVLVGFEADAPVRLGVFVQKENKGYRIIKVEYLGGPP